MVDIGQIIGVSVFEVGNPVIKDVRNAEEQMAVEKFRRVLVAENLLPAKHDNYNAMLK